MVKNLNKQAIVLIALHVLLLFYSLSGIFSKNAASQPFLSIPFVLLYGGMLAVLFVYAIGWQQIIKRLPLTVAFANKAVTVVWGIVWGALVFGETVNVQMILGAVLVIAGIVLYSIEDGRQAKKASAADDGLKAPGRSVDSPPQVENTHLASGGVASATEPDALGVAAKEPVRFGKTAAPCAEEGRDR